MTVTVLAILETDFIPDLALGKIMNERLNRIAAELQDKHLVKLNTVGQRSDDVIVYISYNPKFAVRWRVVNDVPADVEKYVENVCAAQGFIKWNTSVINVFKGNG